MLVVAHCRFPAVGKQAEHLFKPAGAFHVLRGNDVEVVDDFCKRHVVFALAAKAGNVVGGNSKGLGWKENGDQGKNQGKKTASQHGGAPLSVSAVSAAMLKRVPCQACAEEVSRGCCCVRQCRVPRPHTRSTAWIPTTVRSLNTSARIPRATRSAGSLKVGTITASFPTKKFA